MSVGDFTFSCREPYPLEFSMEQLSKAHQTVILQGVKTLLSVGCCILSLLQERLGLWAGDEMVHVAVVNQLIQTVVSEASREVTVVSPH